MKSSKKAWVKFLKWSKWLGVAALVGAVSLGYSWRSYTTSQNKGQEVGIAQVVPEGDDENTYKVTFRQAAQANGVKIYYWQLNEITGLKTHLRFGFKLIEPAVQKEDFWFNGPGEKKVVSIWPVTVDLVKKYEIWNHPVVGEFTHATGFEQVTTEGTVKKCGDIDVTSKLQKARENGQIIAQARCWEAGGEDGIWFTGDTDDYSDFLLIFAVKPTGSPSPSPSSLPGEKVKIRVLKFNDKDGDGNQDTGEGSTNKVWKFRVTVEGVTTPVELTTATVSGLTRWIEVTKGKDVTVKEATKSGWLVSGGPVQIAQNISADKEFKFGNKLVGASPSLTPSPSINPNKTNFRIKKFNDKNANKTQDEGELGLRWRFKYRTKASATAEWPVEWKTDYYTATTSAGLGPKITINKGSLVQVIEYPKTGWKATMGVKKTTVALTDPAKVYIIGFGNKRTGASPSPSVSPDKASFRIRKFNDKNKNGELDSGETSTGKVWEFKYKIGDGEWVTGYKTNASTGVGKIIKVAKGKKVTVEEIEQSGWKVTTDKTQEKTLSEAKQYVFAFGNKKQGGGGGQSPSPTSFPAKQPDTGSPTWLTVGAAGLGIMLLTVRLLLKF